METAGHGNGHTRSMIKSVYKKGTRGEGEWLKDQHKEECEPYHGRGTSFYRLSPEPIERRSIHPFCGICVHSSAVHTIPRPEWMAEKINGFLAILFTKHLRCSACMAPTSRGFYRSRASPKFGTEYSFIAGGQRWRRFGAAYEYFLRYINTHTHFMHIKNTAQWTHSICISASASSGRVKQATCITK